MEDFQTYNTSVGTLIEPDPISYSFNTPGWFFVLGVIGVVLLILLVIQIRNYKKDRYRRDALRTVQLILQQKEQAKCILEINKLLKVLAIRIFGRERVAALHGKAWYEFLMATIPKTETIRGDNFEDYTKALYDEDYRLGETEFDELISLARIWIQNHRRTND